MVVVGAAGSLPVEIGQEVEAVNMAESFLQQGLYFIFRPAERISTS